MEGIEEEETYTVWKAIPQEREETKGCGCYFKKKLDEAIPELNEPVIGFLDESKVDLNPAKRRALNTKVVRYRESAKKGKPRSWTLFGFMAVNGNDVVMASESSTAPNMIEFMKLIMKENPGSEIAITLDNAAIHHAKIVTASLDGAPLHLIFLPPYSPDLNPIEFSWKDIKKELSSWLDFDIMVENAVPVAMEVFKKRKMNYSRNWMAKFIEVKS
ncbi:MAG: IS630 family transposase [Nitrososphaerota archaeon]|nr:IS630 family transposase [Nitrososphaerota archaeon]